MEQLNIRRHDFATREELAAALADRVAQQLRQRIDREKGATLAVSGGSTPAMFFERLSREELDWSAVDVTPVDERFVPETSPRSNASLIRGKLLQNNAAAAQFRPLYRDGVSAEQAADLADDDWDAGDDHVEVVVLGMGTDGHTASFFPDAKELERLLDPASRRHVEAVHAASAGETRLTMTLSSIIGARFLALHIEGEEKRVALESALAPGSRLPIRRVIDAAKIPVEIFWAP